MKKIRKKLSFWSKMVKKNSAFGQSKSKKKQLPPLRPLRDASSGLGTRATTEPAGTSLLLTRWVKMQLKGSLTIVSNYFRWLATIAPTMPYLRCIAQVYHWRFWIHWRAPPSSEPWNGTTLLNLGRMKLWHKTNVHQDLLQSKWVGDPDECSPGVKSWVGLRP